MKVAVIRARCSQDLADKVNSLAAAWGLHPSVIVRQALEDYVAHYSRKPNPLRRTNQDPVTAAFDGIVDSSIDAVSKKARKPKA